MTAIIPTLGRIVWYAPRRGDARVTPDSDGHCAAIVASVLTIPLGYLLRLAVFDANGLHSPQIAVPLVQEGEIAPVEGHYAEWMPYQQQAARHQAAT